jgi:predicted outer membrane repeat protein
VVSFSNVELTGTGFTNEGGIENDGTLSLTDCSFVGNQADNGGAVNNKGDLMVTASTFSSNAAFDVSSGSYYGGAIDNNGTVTVINSTFSGNSATAGGAIYNTGTLTLTSSTLSGNTASSDGGGVVNASTGVVNVANTIIASNTVSGVSSSDPDVSGSFATTDHDLIGIVGDTTGFTDSTSGAAIDGNLVGTTASRVDPKLGLPANNGGPTQTMALLQGSPAIDAGDSAPSAPFSLPTTDQRGLLRITTEDPNVDIGAYEVDQSGVTATAAGAVSMTEGSMAAVTLATVSDPADPTGVVSKGAYAATIDWGDGTSQTAATISGPDSNGVYAITGSHVYPEESATAHTITVVVSRAGASVGSTVTDTVIVADAPLAVANTQIQLQPNAPFSGTVLPAF